MIDPAEDSRAPLRRSVYLLLVVLSAGMMTGRILAVNSVDVIALEREKVKQLVAAKRRQLQEQGLAGDELAKKMAAEQERISESYVRQRPFLSGNDRSRWCTVRALVEHGTYAIDEVIAEENWDTIDMVRHVGRDGRQHLYSSKPTLLPTLVAGEYWVIHKLTGDTLGSHPFAIGRLMLITINVTALAAAMLLLARLAERYGTTDWGRVFVVAAAAFGTLLTTFAVVLNNHVIGAAASIAALYPVLRIWYDGQRRLRYFAAAGLFAAFTAANELPALAFFAALAVAVFYKAPRQAAVAFVPAAAIVAAAFFGTQYAAHGTLTPAYAHRKAGERLFSADAAHRDDLAEGNIPPNLRRRFEAENVELPGDVRVLARESIRKTRGEKHPGWVITNEQVTYGVLDEGESLEVHAWDDWYDYTYKRRPDNPRDKMRISYWSDTAGRAKIDRGEPRLGVYVLHSLVGHHGIFSLTPLWLLSVLGVLLLFRRPTRRPALGLCIAGVSLACLIFFLFLRPVEDRNYGGTSSGFRWMFWLAPAWLVAMIPTADAASKTRLRRGAALLLLALSALSAAYPVWNPWRHPWLWNFMEYLEWIET